MGRAVSSGGGDPWSVSGSGRARRRENTPEAHPRRCRGFIGLRARDTARHRPSRGGGWTRRLDKERSSGRHFFPATSTEKAPSRGVAAARGVLRTDARDRRGFGDGDSRRTSVASSSACDVFFGAKASLAFGNIGWRSLVRRKNHCPRSRFANHDARFAPSWHPAQVRIEKFWGEMGLPKSPHFSPVGFEENARKPATKPAHLRRALRAVRRGSRLAGRDGLAKNRACAGLRCPPRGLGFRGVPLVCFGLETIAIRA